MSDHITSAIIFGLSAFGRHYAQSVGLPRIPFTFSMLMVPALYFMAVNQKERRFVYHSGERRTFEQNLEFYPVTRRAWNRALEIYGAEKGIDAKAKL